MECERPITLFPSRIDFFESLNAYFFASASIRFALLVSSGIVFSFKSKLSVTMSLCEKQTPADNTEIIKKKNFTLTNLIFNLEFHFPIVILVTLKIISDFISFSNIYLQFLLVYFPLSVLKYSHHSLH